MLCGALEGRAGPGEQVDPLCDLTVHLDSGEQLALHSLVLAAASEHFQALGQVPCVLIL